MSTIDNAKANMGFVHAKRRKSCSNCLNAELRDCIHPTWWCNNGGFLVSPLSVCDLHEAGTPPVVTVAATI